jgi:glycosyltransferase involved in cell wall biosynthesis
MPRVSVILTSYNHENFLREAVDSALNQTFSDFELIIWDDASSDNSWAVINSYSDSRIKAFRNDSPKRGIYGINKSVSEVAASDYIAIHHSDDVWERNKLEEQVAFLDSHPEVGAVFSNALAITEAGSPLVDEGHFYAHVFDQTNKTRHEWLRTFFSKGNALCHPSVLIRRACYADCGLYRFGLAQLGDLDMWIRLCLKYEIHVAPEKLVKFRVRNNEANTSGNRPETRIRATYEFHQLLQNYRTLDNFEGLVKVFPSAAKFDRAEKTDVGFALGMIALDEKAFPLTQLFGLDLLFEIISDPKRSEAVKQLYEFGYQDFIALSGQHDVSSRERHETEMKRLGAEVNACQQEILRVKSTLSWRSTAPFRAARNLVCRLWQEMNAWLRRRAA